ncbi:hypothetical protein FB567DRAFT_550329 [Paraphoma chrysanthemicola]|uniref:Uncharacterized protein n=1 Tax=Paraphoma chrysanthemicola TaxID=798071 RepID=A0A8K0VX74_9PLEO|nr:hypothetical protein FB567DRAFT_550329 [Paraphoma chrysanthemicola]
MYQHFGIPRFPTAMDTISECNKSSSPLLRLPAEIRMIVFDYVFLVDHVDGLWCATSSGQSAFAFCTTAQDRVEPLVKLLSPLQTCRQIYQEAALVPFAVNAFRVNIAHLGDLVLALPLKVRRALTFLELEEASIAEEDRDSGREGREDQATPANRGYVRYFTRGENVQDENVWVLSGHRYNSSHMDVCHLFPYVNTGNFYALAKKFVNYTYRPLFIVSSVDVCSGRSTASVLRSACRTSVYIKQR